MEKAAALRKRNVIEKFVQAMRVGVDYHGDLPWLVRDQILSAYDKAHEASDCISVIANSIGAYFAMASLQKRNIQKAYFITGA